MNRCVSDRGGGRTASAKRFRVGYVFTFGNTTVLWFPVSDTGFCLHERPGTFLHRESPPRTCHHHPSRKSASSFIAPPPFCYPPSSLLFLVAATLASASTATRSISSVRINRPPKASFNVSIHEQDSDITQLHNPCSISSFHIYQNRFDRVNT
jgi:hypothetical protein